MRSLNALHGEPDAIHDGVQQIAVPGTEAVGPDNWLRDLGVLMAHRGEVPAPDPRVRAVAHAATLRLRREWLEAEIPRAEVVDQVLASDDRIFARTPTRAFLLDDAATALLVGDGGVRMVENVFTTASRRREGLAAALVRTAVAAAHAGGAELVFLPTSAGGDAQRLYARLGFEDLAHTTLFFRPAD